MMKMNLTAQFKAPITGELCQGRAIDLSDGGMAFALDNEAEAELFEAGCHVSEVVFILGARTFRCEGEIRYRKDISSSKVKKIFKFGLKFKGLTKDEKEIIGGWVLEESSAFFGRL